MAKIKVITDSASDLPADLVATHNITVVPLTVRFGEQEFVDGALSPAEFWAKCKESKDLPETAAPSPGAFQAAYEKAKAEGYDGAIVVALSSALSATAQSATLGAEALKGSFDVRVVDSKAVSMAQGLMTIEVAERAATGASLDDLESFATELRDRVGVVGTIDTLEHLIKGGRLKGAKALLGSMLSIKPLLELKNGEVVEAGRQRTRGKALASLAAQASAVAPLRRLALVHGNAADVDAARDALSGVKVEFPLIVSDMGSVVGTHGGPGIVAVCWIRP